MMKKTIVCGLLAMVGVVSASAEEFPLTFRIIPPKDVFAFPGGYGASAQLRLVKPDKLKKEPKAVSRHPLYGKRARGPAAPPGWCVWTNPRATAKATTSSWWT